MLCLRNEFQGTFDPGCLESSFPPVLNIVSNGPKISLNSEQAEPMRYRALCLPFTYSCVKCWLKKGSRASYHSRIHETPYPLYIATKTYLKVKNAIVDQLHQSVMSVSHDGVWQLAIDIANTSIAQ